MTMEEQMHPDDERLAALAGGDADAIADRELGTHVAGCDRCARLIGDLRGLRVALSELPDLRPSRPIQLVPPIPAPAARPSWVRRLVAPSLVAGSALVLAGAVGLGSGGGLDVTLFGAAAAPSTAVAADRGNAATPPAPSSESDQAPEGPAVYGSPEPAAQSTATPGASAIEKDDQGAPAPSGPPALPLAAILAGIVLIGAGLALRFVVVPRAG